METLAEAVGALSATESAATAARDERLVREVRLGDSAEHTIQSATEIAGRLGHRCVHWAHILLALAQGQTPEVQAAITAASLTTENIRERVGDEPV